MTYSIWLISHEKAVNSYLSSVIKDLADKYQGPEFEPHVTLLGRLSLTLEEVVKGCESLASKSGPLVLETGSIEYSTTYFQCVFVRIKPTPQLMSMYDTAKQILGLTESSVFMPHASLLYGNISYSERQKIVESLDFKPQKFTVNSLVVAPSGEAPPSEWKHLAEFELKN